MKAIKVKQSGGLETIFVDNIEPVSPPRKGEITVRIHAGSLNYHDYLVAAGHLKTDSDRVLLSDGAGVVEQVGEGVTEFKVGDHVVSTFFPQWLAGDVVPSAGDFQQTPGDGMDGYAVERVTRPVEAFTHAPAGWSHAEAATITTAGLTAWRALVADGKLKAGDTILTLGTGESLLPHSKLAKCLVPMSLSLLHLMTNLPKPRRWVRMPQSIIVNTRNGPVK